MQHDVYGELLDCAYRWAGAGGRINDHLWEKLRWLADRAAAHWATPDHGIWEVRTEGPCAHHVTSDDVAIDVVAVAR